VGGVTWPRGQEIPQGGDVARHWLGDDRGRLVEILLIAFGFYVLLFLLPHHLAGDDGWRFQDIELLRTHGKLSSSRFSLAMPLLSLPLLALGTLIKSPEWWATRFNVILVGGASAAAMYGLRGRIDGRLLRRFLLILLFASLLTYHLRTYNTEVADAVFVTCGLIALAVGRTWLGWGLLVYAVVNTPAAVVALALLAVVETVRSRRLRFLLPVVAAVVLIGAEAWVRRGSPFTTGYEGLRGLPTQIPYSGHSGFSFPFALGVLSILFAFGRGLLFFAPGLVLWLSSRTRQIAGATWPLVILFLLFLLGLVLAYAKWWAWYGGNAWGPRFFLVAAVPSSYAIALRLMDTGRSPFADALTLFMLAVSAWIGIVGILASANDAEPVLCTLNGDAVEAFCWYVPEFSSWWQPVESFPSLDASTWTAVVYAVIVFAYLAFPLAVGVIRSAAAGVTQLLAAPGWRF
jgi:hypothetical protein